MSYVKTNWENLPSTNTPLNASNLNKIENQLEELSLNKNEILYTGPLTISTTGDEITLNKNPINEKYKFLCIITQNQYARRFITIIPWYLFDIYNLHYEVVSALNNNDFTLLRISPDFTNNNKKIGFYYDKFESAMNVMEIRGIY